MKGIPTYYRGVEYRSRLEARWAAFFGIIGWQYTYEPFDGDGYIPDFLIHGDYPILVEVKPAVLQEDYWEPVTKAIRGLHDHWNWDILIVGASPLPRCWTAACDDLPRAGLLGEHDDIVEADVIVDHDWDFGPGNWVCCGKCDQLNVFHDARSLTGRPCGHQERLRGVHANAIEKAWAHAINEVKWRGRAA
jgi:hypothetical protein